MLGFVLLSFIRLNNQFTDLAIDSEALPAVSGLGEELPMKGLKKAELVVPLILGGLIFLARRTWWRKTLPLLPSVKTLLSVFFWTVYLWFDQL